MSEKPSFVPPKRTFTVEFAVGIFTLIGMLCFGYLAVNLAGFQVLDAGKYLVEADFDNIAGVKLGAPVELAGVMVGEVSDIKLEDTTARLTLRLDSSVKLREDDIAAVRTKGIIGDRYVKIIPGASEKKLGGGSTIARTESAVELEEILGKFIHRME